MKVSVITHPHAKQPRIETDLLGQLHVYVLEPPLEGRANEAVIEALAAHFHTKKNRIFLLSGASAKRKIFEIT
ncbi:DUF167 domain-containing protein [Patescibacteria group bacterium]|nr:DUF167 domain-containing protein [Patescibacteria group bacterium]